MHACRGAARRAFQARELANAAAIDVERATTLVEQVKPSDGFKRPEVGGNRAPRLQDPCLSYADHQQMSALLHELWQAVGLRRSVAEWVKRLATALENLQCREWPFDQFGTTIRDTCYGGWSPTYLDDVHRAPKWISHEAFEDVEGC